MAKGLVRRNPIPWIVTLIGLASSVGALLFVKDPSLGLELENPIILLAWEIAFYGGGLVVIVGLVWSFETFRRKR